MIVLSPHLDDAVFSAGALLAHLPGAIVVTICAGIPDASTGPSSFDVRSGFSSGAEAVRERRREDHTALASIKAKAIHLDCLDAVYGSDQPIADAVAEALSLADGECVLAPLGLHHPDHQAVAEALTAVPNLWRYEERPYGVRWPAEVGPALERAGCATEPVEVPCSEAKLAAMSHYPSQLVETDLAPYREPERFYRC